jgi:hypothetical protein
MQKGPFVTHFVNMKGPVTIIPGQPQPFNLLRLQRWIACRSCNGGWMEQDRHVVAPLVRGDTITLSEDDQKRIARWAVKTTMTYEFASMTNKRVISPPARRWFFHNQTPPPGTNVWIASTAEDGGHKDAFMTAHHFLPQPEKGNYYGAFAVSSLFCLGELQLLTLLTTINAPDDLWPDFPQVGRGVVPQFRKIWPSPGSISFPIEPKFSGQDAAELSMCVFEFLRRLGMKLPEQPPPEP